MFLKKVYRVTHLLFSFELRRLSYYRVDFLIDVFSKIAYLVLNLFFWYVVYDTGYIMEGWDYSSMIAFIAFSELFYGLDNAIFSMSSRFWRYIYSGALDNALTRPIDPRLRFVILNIDYTELLLSFVEFIVLLCVSGRIFDPIRILWGIVWVILANIILTLMRLCGSYIAFWHGKMNAVSEISDCLTSFNKYPLTIMPKTVVILFKFIVPFYFFSTFSAELVCSELTKGDIMVAVVGTVCTSSIWIVINKILWKKGLERYESING